MNKCKFEEIVNYIAKLIKDTEFENKTYVVGGAVRDYVMNNEIKDIDLVVETEDGGLKLAQFFEDNNFTSSSIITYPRFGTAMFHLSEFPDYEIEAVHTRKEYYPDENSRDPKQSYGSITEDCFRRDLTINALYMKVNSKEIFDFTNKGLEDIKNHVIRTTNENPDKVFQEDPLRILRVIRFASRYNWQIEEKTYNSIVANRDRLKIISKERIQDEFNKMLLCDNVNNALWYLTWSGVYQYITPGVPYYDVNLNTSCVTRSIPARLSYILLSSQYSIQEIKALLKDLKYDNDTINKVEMYLRVAEEARELVKNVIRTEDLRKFITFCKTQDALEIGVEIEASYCSNDREKLIVLLFDCERLLRSGMWSFDYKMPVNGIDIKEKFPDIKGVEIKEKLKEVMELCYENPYISKDEILETI